MWRHESKRVPYQSFLLDRWCVSVYGKTGEISKHSIKTVKREENLKLNYWRFLLNRFVVGFLWGWAGFSMDESSWASCLLLAISKRLLVLGILESLLLHPRRSDWFGKILRVLLTVSVQRQLRWPNFLISPLQHPKNTRTNQLLRLNSINNSNKFMNSPCRAFCVRQNSAIFFSSSPSAFPFVAVLDVASWSSIEAAEKCWAITKTDNNRAFQFLVNHRASKKCLNKSNEPHISRAKRFDSPIAVSYWRIVWDIRINISARWGDETLPASAVFRTHFSMRRA